MAVSEQPLFEQGTIPAAQPADQAEDADQTEFGLAEGGIQLGDTIRLAFTSLLANKLRTLLTSLGVIIGVMAVVALLAIGRGSQDTITSAITANGSNLLTVRPGASTSGGFRGEVGSGQNLTMADAEALADPANVPAAAGVSPESGGSAQLVAGSQNLTARITGATPFYLTAHNLTLSDGEFISDGNVSSANSVAVLGANVAATLFPDGAPVGWTLKIRSQSFRVIGVLTGKGGSGFGSLDDAVIIPITTSQKKLFGTRSVGSGGSFQVSTIVVQAVDQNSVDQALEQIAQTLRARHNLPVSGGDDDFSIINQQDILDTAVQTTRVLTLFLGAIAAISLLVGGIGIMNIMLVSVSERTREIGLRKALGARDGDILLQFMIEALTMTTAGGLLGLSLGAIIALLVNQTGLVRTSVSLSSVVLAIGFSMLVGLFFGIEPARRAARLDPIDALRHD